MQPVIYLGLGLIILVLWGYRYVLPELTKKRKNHLGHFYVRYTPRSIRKHGDPLIRTSKGRLNTNNAPKQLKQALRDLKKGLGKL